MLNKQKKVYKSAHKSQTKADIKLYTEEQLILDRKQKKMKDQSKVRLKNQCLGQMRLNLHNNCLEKQTIL